VKLGGHECVRMARRCAIKKRCGAMGRIH
jgi:hypothetical protein